ncbi:MAG: hypothetical protein ABR910_08600 [Acidobacteriaceae bacterium]|jgi:hypothetical protein
MEGSWAEKDVEFHASLTRAGQNTVALTGPADAIANQVAPQ